MKTERGRREAIHVSVPPVSLRHARIMAERRCGPDERLLSVSKHPSKGWYLAEYESLNRTDKGSE